jgi:hypothetical protein
VISLARRVRGARGAESPSQVLSRLGGGGKASDLVIEITSASTKEEDIDAKMELYRDTLKVREYFLFDPFGDYLKPPLRGYTLVKDRYLPIKPIAGRLPSKVLGLHLEHNGNDLRLYNPATGRWLPPPPETVEQLQQFEAALEHERAALRREEAARRQEQAARQRAEAELARLRAELEALKRSRPNC